MANKNKLIRLQTLDACLRNKYRRYTLEDLIEACSEALYEYEGVQKGIGKRSVQEDIRDMRSGKFGYEAPILCAEGIYFYSDPNFTISNSPLTDDDYKAIQNALAVLEQFSELGQLEALRQVEAKLQQSLSVGAPDAQHTYIEFEKTEYPAAEKWLSRLLPFVKSRQGLTLTYQPFSHEAPNTYETTALLLKEFSGRWFLVGYNHKYSSLQNFALDRLHDVQPNKTLPIPADADKLLHQLKHLIGVSMPETGIEQVVFRISPFRRKYIETKPLHSSQHVIDDAQNIFALQLGVNVELKSRLLSFGAELEVLEPGHLRESLREEFKEAMAGYGMHPHANMTSL